MTTRRTFVSTAALAPVLAATARLEQPALAQDEPATFVLVHGAWAGGWVWRDIIPKLQEAGHRVFATTATGMGDRQHLANPAIDLDTHIADVVQTIEFEDLHDVILVGWSYGGLIITGVAEQIPERLATIVYVDATVPADGQTGYEAELYSDEAIAADVMSGLDAGLPGFFTIEPLIGWISDMTKDPAVLEWLLDHLTPQTLATYTQPIQVSNPDAAAVPHVFLFCTEAKGTPDVDHTVRTLERVQADPDWTVIELADNHLVPINNPELFVETLLSLT